MGNLRKIFLCFILFVCFESKAQDRIIDSLKTVLTTAINDTNKVNTLNAISKGTVNKVPEQAIIYATQALQLADSLQYIKGKAFAYKWIGVYYFNTSKNLETLHNWLKSLELFKLLNDKNGVANISNNIGSLYYQQADDVKALEYFLQSLKLSEEINDKNRIATALGNIGNTYLRKPATQEKAIQYLLRALPIFIELKNQDGIVTMCTNLGEGYLDVKKADSALYYYRMGLKESNNTEEVTTIFIWNNIGKAYSKKGDFEEAIKFQKKSIALAQKLNSKFNEGKSTLGLAETYYEKGDIANALSAYIQAEPLLVANRAVEELRDTYKGLYLTYEKKGDFFKANKYLNLYSDYKDSIYNSENDKKLASRQFDYDLREKEAKITLLNKDNALKELDLTAQKNTRNAFAIGFILILTIAFVLYYSYLQKVKTNVILDKQKAQIETLMLNILPEEVSNELKETGKATPRYYESVSVLFTDFKGFTKHADKLSPQALIEELNASFIAFDDIAEKNDIEKIKTIGDSYMCAAGIPTTYEGHALNMVKTGLEMQDYILNNNQKREKLGLLPWELRIGIHVGPVVSGVVGKKKYAYDIWGNAVNVASRMESNGEVGRVNISAATYELVKHVYACSYRGKIYAKNVGEIDMYFVDGKLSDII
ncbi:MAG: adenylate/guanylate cyclase domain-containing protein [Bacteroidota bacterium]